MAQMTYIDENSKEGRETLEYIEHLRIGLAGLLKQEGRRAHSAAITVEPMKLIFGISDSEGANANAGAEAFRDRLNAINAGNLAGLKEFCDVTLADPTKV